MAGELVRSAEGCLSTRPTIEAAVALEVAIEAVPRRRLRTVDECVRSSAIQWLGTWSRLTPRELTRADMPRVAVIVAASHYDGHVREAAVRLLAGTRDVRALPIILLRLNDWVDEVRRAARSALAQYVEPEFGPALLTLLPMIEALGQQRRGQHEAVIGWVLNLLAMPGLREARIAACRDPDVEVRAACLRFSSEADPSAAPQLLELALGDAEPKIRVWAVRRAGAALPAAWARALVERALRDRGSQVRRIALDLLGESLSDAEIVAITDVALLDEASATRWQAHRLRLRVAPIDFAAFYRAALVVAATPKRTRGALLGLGEWGDSSDVRLLTPHLEAGGSGIRRAAMRALGRLEPAEVVEPFFVALSDRLPGVASEARRALQDRIAHVRTDRLLAITGSSTASAQARAHAARLGARLSKWDALLVMLDALGNAGAELPASIPNALASWVQRYNRSFVRPTREQLDASEHAVARARLGAGLGAEVRHILHVSRSAWGV